MIMVVGTLCAVEGLYVVEMWWSGAKKVLTTLSELDEGEFIVYIYVTLQPRVR